jgi:hypothetical protein
VPSYAQKCIDPAEIVRDGRTPASRTLVADQAGVRQAKIKLTRCRLISQVIVGSSCWGSSRARLDWPAKRNGMFVSGDVFLPFPERVLRRNSNRLPLIPEHRSFSSTERLSAKRHVWLPKTDKLLTFALASFLRRSFGGGYVPEIGSRALRRCLARSGVIQSRPCLTN